MRFEAYRGMIFILCSEAWLKSNQGGKIRQVWTNSPTSLQNRFFGVICVFFKKEKKKKKKKKEEMGWIQKKMGWFQLEEKVEDNKGARIGGQ